MRRTGPSAAPAAPPNTPPPPSRDRIAFLALAVLDEAIEQARRGLWFEREPYIEFWQGATQHDEAGDGADGYGRRIHMTAAFNAIARAAGTEITPDVAAGMRKAREGGYKKGPA